MGYGRSGTCCIDYICDRWLMLRKIGASIKALPVNAVVCCITVALYFSNNLYFKAHSTGIIHMLLVCHFNDFIGGALFVAYTNIILYTRKMLLKKLWQISLFCFTAGLFWEFVTPLFRKNTTSDWIDVACYVLGGFVYWLLLCKWGTDRNVEREHKK